MQWFNGQMGSPTARGKGGKPGVPFRGEPPTRHGTMSRPQLGLRRIRLVIFLAKVPETPVLYAGAVRSWYLGEDPPTCSISYSEEYQKKNDKLPASCPAPGTTLYRHRHNDMCAQSEILV